MSRLTRRVAVKARGAGAKTYADWVAHVNSVSRSFDASAWGTRTSVNPVGDGIYRTTATTANHQGTTGSSWNAYFIQDSDMRGVVQHGLPSQAAFNEQVTNSGVMLVTLENVSDQSAFAGRLRNGLQTTTLSDSFAYPATTLSKLSFWNFTLGKPQTMTPNVAGGPVDYAASGW